jgi:transposase
MAYDEKYRRLALEYWNAGHSKKETAVVFKVGTTTLQEWKSLLKATGTLAPKKRKPTWRKIDPSKLKKYVDQHPDAYLREIAAEFNCAVHAVEHMLAREKISRKKNFNLS